MRPSDPPEDLIPESGTVLSRQILTPKGGFMARPGLKPPPRHAVVVRGGDAPVTEEIPVARSSFLPPPPPSDPEARALAEKETLRAIPTRSAPPLESTPAPLAVMPEVAGPSFIPPAPRPAALDSLRPVIESIPPPSDAPVVAGVDEPRSRRRQRSRWTIVLAAAVGLALGMVSVATTVSLRGAGAPVAAAPPAVVVLQAPPAAPAEAKTARLAPAPSSRADGAATAPSAGPQRQPEPLRPAPPKRSIF